MACTFHTYPDLLISGGRLAATVWPTPDPAAAVAATLARDPDGVILRATCGAATLRALAPGGMAA
jgi:hypothetical protein